MVRDKNKESQPLQHAGSMFFFIFIAALLWLAIKLSARYTVTEPLTIILKDQPSDLVIINDTQVIQVTLSTTGFKLLNYYFKPTSRRKVAISLEEVPLHNNSDGTYSFGSNYAKEIIAHSLSISPNEISFDENRIVLNMEQLMSKKVKVLPNIDISYDNQYNRHGNIIIKPDSITIYGPENIIKGVDYIYTEKQTFKNVNFKIDANIPVNIADNINTDIKTVNVKMDVDRYTEAVANVTIKNNSKQKLRLFPDKIKIKYIVSLTDYNIITDKSFCVEIDTAQISQRLNYLPVYLTDYPNNTKILSVEPKEVEYIIIEENEN